MVAFGPGAEAQASRLRARGTVAVTAQSRAEALAWARGWGFSHVLDASTGASIAAAHLGDEDHVQEREGES